MERVHMALGSLLRELRRDESGAVESAQIFAWIAVTVVAIMALGALLNQLGVDVISWVRTQIGI